MSDAIPLGGRVLLGRSNAASGGMGGDIQLPFEQDGERIRATYAGDVIREGHLVRTFEDDRGTAEICSSTSTAGRQPATRLER